MTDDTIRTRAISYTRSNWKAVLHVTSWALAGSAAVLVSMGRTQSDALNSKEKMKDAITRIETKVDGLVTDVSQIKMKQAEDGRAQKDMGERIGRIEDNWDNAFQHAGDWPRPRKRK